MLSVLSAVYRQIKLQFTHVFKIWLGAFLQTLDALIEAGYWWEAFIVFAIERFTRGSNRQESVEDMPRYAPPECYISDRKPRVIRHSPGSRILTFANFIYSKKTVDRVFSQIIHDMREEYIEALALGNKWHARWIHIRGVLSFLTTVVVHAGSSIAVKVFKMVSALWVA